MIHLTAEQVRELKGQEPVQVLDPDTKNAYVLMPADLYERLRRRLEEEDEIESVRQMYPHFWDVMKVDWDDPAMQAYDRLPLFQSPE